MVRFVLRQLIGSRAGPVVLGAVLALPANRLSAQDYMGMAELYGQGVVNSLGNQIRSAGIRSSMGRSGTGTGGAAAARWPAHITASSVGSHVFTVDELQAMNSADAVRTGQLLNGRTINITGTVVHPPRTDQAIHLVSGDGQGFHVFAFFPGGRGMPQAGTHITLEATVERVRRTMVSVRNPQVTGRGTPPTGATGSTAQTSGAATGSASPNYHALTFRSTTAVTNELADRFAETLAPALRKGRSRQDIATLVRSGQLQNGFRTLLRPYGFSDRDVADVLASHMVMIWQVANDHHAQPPRSHVIAVRSRTREALARSGWVQAMDDADKQRFAETLSVGTMMIVGRYVNGYDTNDRATIDLAVRDAKEMARSFADLDMTRYALTDQGLTPR